MTDRRHPEPRLLYCHCAYAKVIDAEVKQRVLGSLCASGRSFDAVSDLCEMSAHKDPALVRIGATGPLRIIACYPRAVRGLFRAARVPLSEDVEILNMRQQSAAEIERRALGDGALGDGTAASDATDDGGSEG